MSYLMAFSSIVRFIPWRADPQYSHCISRRAAAGFANRDGGWVKAAAMNDASVNPQPEIPTKFSPWLMLPPDLEIVHKIHDGMVYKFYDLRHNRIGRVNLGRHGQGAGGQVVEMPDEEAEFVGSSHGWLASYDRRKGQMLLFSPISGRHIRLPPPPPTVKNVIVSSAPDDDEDFRAMMIYSPENRLAFCCPGRGATEWTPLGNGTSAMANYQACVYSKTQNLFFCIKKDDDHYFDAWDLNNPQSPTMTLMDVSANTANFPVAHRSEEEREVKSKCRTWKYLVVDEDDHLFHVRRFTDDQRMGGGMLPYKTVDFDVHKYDKKERAWKHVDGSLGGLAFFVGENHGLALPASEYPELKEDAIYFTDIKEHIPTDPTCNYGGHDIGIFDYGNKTLMWPCFDPCHLVSMTRISPPPVWVAINIYKEWVGELAGRYPGSPPMVLLYL